MKHIIAIVSVWADYFEIHRRSYVHGLDRSFATVMLLRALYCVLVELQPWTLLLASFPIVCYSRSAGSKLKLDIEGWKFWHCAWHISGGLLGVALWSLITHCAEAEPQYPAVCKD